MSTLGPISCVTVAAPELQFMIDSYRLFLGYRLVDHGRLSPAQASLWGLPNLTGRRYGLMLPEGEGQTFLRFVESKPSPGYVPFRHMGWNAAELMVQDTDKAAARLAGSPFKIIGPPANLSISDKIRAAQALGRPPGAEGSLAKLALSGIARQAHAVHTLLAGADGMLTGVNIEATVRLAQALSIPVIASGGLSGMSDIESLCAVEDEGIEAVICGRSIYTGDLDFVKAQERADELGR